MQFAVTLFFLVHLCAVSHNITVFLCLCAVNREITVSCMSMQLAVTLQFLVCLCAVSHDVMFVCSQV